MTVVLRWCEVFVMVGAVVMGLMAVYALVGLIANIVEDWFGHG